MTTLKAALETLNARKAEAYDRMDKAEDANAEATRKADEAEAKFIEGEITEKEFDAFADAEHDAYAELVEARIEYENFRKAADEMQKMIDHLERWF